MKRIAIALVLVASTASASSPDSDPSKGGDAPPSSGPSDARNIGIEQVDKDKVAEEQATKKKVRFEGGATWESHALFVQNDLQGSAPDKFFLYYGGYFRTDLFQHNRFEIRTGFYQRFLADPQESGVRMDDVVFSYARIVPLPQQFRLSVRASVLAPTSFISQKMGMITAPRLTLQGDKAFGKYVSLTLRTFGEGYIQQYTAMEGGAPNPIARVGGSFEASVAMPFHAPLSLGAMLYTGYTWFYDATGTPVTLTGYPSGIPRQVQVDPQFDHQPTQQSYGGEIYVGYNLPSLAGVKGDVHVALANGDPSLGFQSRLHDGVSHFYLAFRNTAQVYGALTFRY